VTKLAVRLTPRGGRDAIEGFAPDEAGRPLLKARVAAPPVEGEANAALIRLLAKTLGLPRTAVRIAAGETQRVKILEIDGLDEAEVRRRLS
jgi:uncharacterized protein YggU (UPF0235/DUF167 family)